MKKIIAIICCVLCSIIGTTYCAKLNGVSAEGVNLAIGSRSCFLMDYNSGTVLYEENADERVPVASIVKLMTTLITFEEIDKGNLQLNDKLVASEHAASMGGSQVFIDPYAEYTVEEMIKSVIVASANDASVALAEKIAGSEEAFVARMNERAKELGLKNTKYVNASGLPEPGQYSTARDVAFLTKEVLKNKRYFEYSTIWLDELTHPSGRKTELANTNKLIRYFKDCDAGKTGSTDEAGYCLTASANRNNMRLIAVVLGATTGTARFNETSKLLTYGFNNFENKQVINSLNSISSLDVLKSKTKNVDIYPSEDYFVVCKKGENAELEYVIELPEKIAAPIKKGDCVGKLKILKNGATVYEIDLVVLDDIEKLTYLDSVKEIISNW